MRAPRRRGRALAGAGAGSRSPADGGSTVHVPPRLRYAAQDASFQARQLARRIGKVVTPLRAAAAVAAVAAVCLAVSQSLDYRSVAVGTGDYAAYPGIESVAPAPDLDLEREGFGFAHASLMVGLALAALVAAALSLGGRRRLGWVVTGLGLIAVAVALAIDLPAGLDEGGTAIAYQGAEASLESGFWVELVTAGALAASGALLVLHGTSTRRPTRRPRPEKRGGGK